MVSSSLLKEREGSLQSGCGSTEALTFLGQCHLYLVHWMCEDVWRAGGVKSPLGDSFATCLCAYSVMWNSSLRDQQRFSSSSLQYPAAIWVHLVKNGGSRCRKSNRNGAVWQWAHRSGRWCLRIRTLQLLIGIWTLEGPTGLEPCLPSPACSASGQKVHHPLE